MHFRAAAALAIAVAMNGNAPDAVAQPSGGFGGFSGGGPRPTGGSNLGYNRAGTASSGGFAYGDAPRREPTVTVVTQGSSGPCNVNPVTVDNTPYYKCNGTWYTPALTATGIGYTKVAPPPGY
jgi:hypothetical protein